MRKFQKATAVIMAAALAATGCSSGGAKTSDTQQPSGTDGGRQRQMRQPALIRQRLPRILLPVKRSLCWWSIQPEARP